MNFPRDYHYCLFQVKVPDLIDKTVLAVSPEDALARLKMSEAQIEPFMLIRYISKHGHTATTKFLKTFGSEWSTKDGMVFYK